jgi:hypothetical protein
MRNVVRPVRFLLLRMHDEDQQVPATSVDAVQPSPLPAAPQQGTGVQWRVPFVHRGVSYRAELQPDTSPPSSTEAVAGRWILVRVTGAGDTQWVAHMNFDPNERSEDVAFRARSTLDRLRRT